MYDILALGETVIDFTPIKIKEQESILYEFQAGGAPSNMLAAAAKLGSRCALISIVGDDPLGEYLVKTLKNASVDTRGVIVTGEAPTFFVLLTINEAGDSSYIKLQTRTAIDVLTSELIDYSLIEKCKIFHIAGSMFNSDILLNAANKAIEYAKATHKLISCDVNWRSFVCNKNHLRSILTPILPSINILKVSEEELEILTDTNSYEKGAGMLFDLGVSFVVVTLGKKGCFYFYGDGSRKLSTYDVPVLNTNASGDIFMGALLAQLTKINLPLSNIPQKTINDIMDNSNAAGAISATRNGAISAAPTWEEINNCKRNTLLLI